MTVRAVGYVRVSQERDGMVSPEVQLYSIRAHCEKNGYELTRIVTDIDETGRVWTSRKIDKCVRKIERGKADVLVVWRVSRVSRMLLDWAQAISRIERAGGRLESATEHFDTQTATGRFARGVMAELSVFESDRIAEMYREVHQRRLRLGLPPVGGRQFGYRIIDKQYVPHPVTGPLLADCYRRYVAGESFADLHADLMARRRRVRSDHASWPFAVSDALILCMDRGFAAGLINWRGEQFPGSHRPLINAAEWAAYQRAREERRVVRVTRAETFLLHGLLRCPDGKPMKPEIGGSGIPEYTCLCRARRIMAADRAEELVHRWLSRLVTDQRHGDLARRRSAEAAARYAAAAGRLTRRINEHTSPSRLRRLADVEARAAWHDPIVAARELFDGWDTLTVAAKQHLLRRLVDHFVVREAGSWCQYATIIGTTTWGTHTGYAARLIDPEQPGEHNRERWITSTHVCSTLGVAAATLHAMRHAGLLPKTRTLATGMKQLHLYAASDVQRVLNGPRTYGNRYDRKELLREIAAES